MSASERHCVASVFSVRPCPLVAHDWDASPDDVRPCGEKVHFGLAIGP